MTYKTDCEEVLRPAKLPHDTTLKLYGLTMDEWLYMYRLQLGLCAVCGKAPKKNFCVDHAHVRGWRKMQPAQRRKYVRQLLCVPCNLWLLGAVRFGFKASDYRKAADYLERHGVI